MCNHNGLSPSKTVIVTDSVFHQITIQPGGVPFPVSQPSFSIGALASAATITPIEGIWQRLIRRGPWTSQALLEAWAKSCVQSLFGRKVPSMVKRDKPVLGNMSAALEPTPSYRLVFSPEQLPPKSLWCYSLIEVPARAWGV